MTVNLKYHGIGRFSEICGMCVKNCPMEALKKTKNGIEINKTKCINCLVCMETCLHGAVLCKRIPLFI